jgi:hypothetical protein
VPFIHRVNFFLYNPLMTVQTVEKIGGTSAEHYFTKNWTKHLESLPKFGIQVKGLWSGNTPESEKQVIALVSFPHHANMKKSPTVA